VQLATATTSTCCARPTRRADFPDLVRRRRRPRARREAQWVHALALYLRDEHFADRKGWPTAVFIHAGPSGCSALPLHHPEEIREVRLELDLPFRIESLNRGQRSVGSKATIAKIRGQRFAVRGR
jgi:hypothetical protein